MGPNQNILYNLTVIWSDIQLYPQSQLGPQPAGVERIKKIKTMPAIIIFCFANVL